MTCKLEMLDAGEQLLQECLTRISEEITDIEREIEEENSNNVVLVIQESSLPSWVITGIRQMVWKQWNSHGQAKVDKQVIEWIGIFEQLKGNDYV